MTILLRGRMFTRSIPPEVEYVLGADRRVYRRGKESWAPLSAAGKPLPMSVPLDELLRFGAVMEVLGL